MKYSQLSMGKKVEREHHATYEKVKDYQQSKGKMIPKKEFYGSIAKDHLKEDKKYYTKLQNAKL